ncbi:hypothetical protein GF340_00260 [Candidatus Peregrinibacteria bacterium]|nr:hypothetical protein [Candidatus Peregrinibacteria bacterium]
MKGAFITLYGINNIGKSTQAKLLVEGLKGFGLDAVYLKYPIYDLEPTGPAINAILRNEQKQKVSEEELQTLFTQNRKDFEPQLEKMIQDGKVVIAEDYAGTGIAWGTAKGLDFDRVTNLNKDLKKEDFAILLKGERFLSAREQVHIHEQDDELVGKVGRVLQMMSDKYGWHEIEVKGRIPETAEVLFNVVLDFLRDFRSQ